MRVRGEFRLQAFDLVLQMDDLDLHLREGLFLHLDELLVVLGGFKGARKYVGGWSIAVLLLLLEALRKSKGLMIIRSVSCKVYLISILV